MRGNFNSIVPLPSYRRKLAPHPACGHLPPQGEGSPQKASPFGRSCRPQAADEGGVRAVSLLTGSIRRLSPHPTSVGASATFPRRGKALPKRLLPPGEAAARRRLMRGNFNSIVPLPSYRRKLAPHPACGHLPPQGEGSPQKASPFGRSCRPQAADEGGVRAVSLLTGSIRRLSPHPTSVGASATFPRRGKALPKRLLPPGEAAARRRLMRAEFVRSHF